MTTPTITGRTGRCHPASARDAHGEARKARGDAHGEARDAQREARDAHGEARGARAEDTAVLVQGLTKSYGATPVLREVDLSVERGSVHALLGPNGAGKTTLISILSTLLDPDAGRVEVDGHDLSRDPAAIRRSISLTGQYASVDGVLTGAENLLMVARLLGFTSRGASARAAEMLELFDLTEAAHRRVSTWSGGMRRRLDLAASLVAGPSVVVLDEPTTGLDTRSRQELWAVVGDLARAGTTVLLTTQYLEEADHLADRVSVLDHGRIVAEGTPAELKSRVGGEVVELLEADGTVVRREATDGSAADLGRAVGLLAADQAAGTGRRITVHGPSLEEVFLALTGHVAAGGEGPAGTPDAGADPRHVAAGAGDSAGPSAAGADPRHATRSTARPEPTGSSNSRGEQTR